MHSAITIAEVPVSANLTAAYGCAPRGVHAKCAESYVSDCGGAVPFISAKMKRAHLAEEDLRPSPDSITTEVFDAETKVDVSGSREEVAAVLAALQASQLQRPTGCFQFKVPKFKVLGKVFHGSDKAPKALQQLLQQAHAALEAMQSENEGLAVQLDAARSCSQDQQQHLDDALLAAALEAAELKLQVQRLTAKNAQQAITVAGLIEELQRAEASDTEATTELLTHAMASAASACSQLGQATANLEVTRSQLLAANELLQQRAEDHEASYNAMKGSLQREVEALRFELQAQQAARLEQEQQNLILAAELREAQQALVELEGATQPLLRAAEESARLLEKECGHKAVELGQVKARLRQAEASAEGTAKRLRREVARLNWRRAVQTVKAAGKVAALEASADARLRECEQWCEQRVREAKAAAATSFGFLSKQKAACMEAEKKLQEQQQRVQQVAKQLDDGVDAHRLEVKGLRADMAAQEEDWSVSFRRLRESHEELQAAHSTQVEACQALSGQLQEVQQATEGQVLASCQLRAEASDLMAEVACLQAEVGELALQLEGARQEARQATADSAHWHGYYEQLHGMYLGLGESMRQATERAQVLECEAMLLKLSLQAAKDEAGQATARVEVLECEATLLKVSLTGHLQAAKAGQ